MTSDMESEARVDRRRNASAGWSPPLFTFLRGLDSKRRMRRRGMNPRPPTSAPHSDGNMVTPSPASTSPWPMLNGRGGVLTIRWRGDIARNLGIFAAGPSIRAHQPTTPTPQTARCGHHTGLRHDPATAVPARAVQWRSRHERRTHCDGRRDGSGITPLPGSGLCLLSL